MADKFKIKMDKTKRADIIKSDDRLAFWQKPEGFEGAYYDKDGVLVADDTVNPGSVKLMKKYKEKKQEAQIQADKEAMKNSIHPQMVETITEMKQTISEFVETATEKINELSQTVEKQKDRIVELEDIVYKGKPKETPEVPKESPPDPETSEDNQDASSETNDDSDSEEDDDSDFSSVNDTTVQNQDDDDFDFVAWVEGKDDTHHATVGKMIKSRFNRMVRTKEDMIEVLAEEGVVPAELAKEAIAKLM